MGRDKALIEIDGLPLWQRQLRVLEELQPAEIFLSGLLPCDRYPHIPDACDHAGPLGGIVASLRICSTPLLVVLAIDLPQMTSGFLQELLSLSAASCGVVPGMPDRLEPLAAVYPRLVRALAEDSLRSGDYSMQEFCRRALAAGLVRLKEIEQKIEPLFFNMNTPNDLDALRSNRPSEPGGDALPSILTTNLIRHDAKAGNESRTDQVAVEEPLEIRIEGRSIAVVMRTPGHDRELAAGFLLSENIVQGAPDIFDITQCGSATADNLVDVALTNPKSFDPSKLTRNVFSSSSCGICSKATIEAVRQNFPAIENACRVSAQMLLTLPNALRENQETFNRTGGLHACALFDLDGNLKTIREDVGRHNALDKLIGQALLRKELPLSDRVLFLSGRVSFEMMQKALAAGIPIVAAISAPTSLAVEFARESNQTLVGFIRGETMNIYAGNERIVA